MSTAQDQPKIRVFISYSQHDPNHSKRVLEFAKALTKCGMDVELDQFHTTEIVQWPQWCEDQLSREKSDFVLMICSAEYRRRIENKVPADQGRGVYWEGGSIYDYIYGDKANDRFIPILFDDEPKDSLPRKVSNWTWFRIQGFEIDSDKGYENLYRLLTKQPPVVKPELGPIRFLSQDNASRPSKAFAGDAATAEQRYALVIGINEYQHEQPGDEKSRSREFTNLDFAKQDATEFAKFLKDDQGYKVELLDNSKAGLKQIMEAMDRLRAKCKQAPNALVLFFFSGHGWQDQEGRHYLVPHDGRKDEPFSTLLWSRLFDLSLGEVQTKRLVVFLDTCHAGGIGDVGVRGDAPPECNPQTLLQDLNNRYVVASCKAQQLSREYKGHEHGIFTHHLLELLRLKTNDFDNCEEVDLWDLWSALKVKVTETAQTAYNAIQEPWANFADRSSEKKTGIILAINAKFKKRRKDKEERFLKALMESDPIRGRGDSPDINFALTKFIKDGKRLNLDPRFFDCFQRGTTIHKPDDTPKVQILAMQLVEFWSPGAQQLSVESDKSASRGATSVQDLSGGSDNFARGVASIGIADASQVGTALTSPSTTPQALDEKRQEVKKKLSEEDCDYVIKPLTSVVELRRLRGLLGDVTGVSKEDFKSWGKNTKIEDAQLEEIEKRFNEKWNSAQEQVTLKSALDVRTQ